MKGKYLIINIGLVIISIILGLKVFEILSSAPEKSAYNEKAKEMASKPAERPTAEMQLSPPPDYQTVVEKDVFRPSRTKPAPVEIEVKPLPKFNLYGILLIGEKKRAIIGADQPVIKPRSFKIGDIIEGFEVVDILKNRVILKRGEEKVEVALKTSFINLPSLGRKGQKQSGGGASSASAQQALPPAFFQFGDKPPGPPPPQAAPAIKIVPAPQKAEPKKP